MSEPKFLLALLSLCVSCAAMLASIRRIQKALDHYHSRVRALEDYAVGIGKRAAVLEDEARSVSQYIEHCLPRSR